MLSLFIPTPKANTLGVCRDDIIKIKFYSIVLKAVLRIWLWCGQTKKNTEFNRTKHIYSYHECIVMSKLWGIMAFYYRNIGHQAYVISAFIRN